MAAGLGSDFACVTDVDANLSVVSGRRCLAEGVARRLGTPRRHLFYAPDDYGDDISELIGSHVTENRMQARIEAEALLDERVQDARAKVVLKRPGDPGVGADEEGDLEIELRLTDLQGPFGMTLDASQGELSLEALTG